LSPSIGLGRILRRLNILPPRAQNLPPSRYPDSHVVGWVDNSREAERISGWAFSTLSPRRRLTIVATVDGAVVAKDLADRYRADVDRGFGESDGYCGFSISTARLPAGRLRLVAAEFDIEISAAPEAS